MTVVAKRRVRRSSDQGTSHGTWSKYSGGCRCLKCSVGATEYGRARRAAVKAGIPFVIPSHLLTDRVAVKAVTPVPVTAAVETVTRRYTYSASVAPAVAGNLNRAFGSSRFVFNAYLAHARAEYAAGRKHPSFYDGCKAIVTEGRKNPDTAWLRELPTGMLQLAVRDGAQAYENFFASVTGKRAGPKMGRPRFRKRAHRQSAAFPAGAFAINGGWESTSSTGGRVWLSKIGYVTVNWHRPLPAAPSSAKVIRNSDGSHAVSFVVEMQKPRPRIATRQGRAAGIDMGLTDFATIVHTDGSREKIGNPRFLRHAERKLRRLQKNLSRKQKGSRNRERARIELARAYDRVTNLRTNHARQLTSRLIRENQAIAVETLNVRGLARTRLARSIHDAGWANFLQTLEEGCVQNGRHFQKVPAFFPSSQLCSACGTGTGKKPLHVRAFTCPHCGTSLDRDFNAAVNILVAAGPAETVNACGRDIRQRLAMPSAAVASEAGTHPKRPRPRGGRVRRTPGAEARVVEAISRERSSLAPRMTTGGGVGKSDA